jgi:alpha-mannosidase
MRWAGVLSVWAITSSALAQVDLSVFGKQLVINGYAKDIEGEVLSYFSVYPEHATTALLTRCTDGKKAIGWETAIVPYYPQDENIQYYYFSWIAAHNSTTSGGDRSFDLFINDQLALTFTTHHNTKPGSWSTAGADSTKLVFEFSKMDRHGDAHGFAHLRVPRKYIAPGKPVRIKVVGHAQESPDWFMTFRYTFEEKVVVEVLPFLTNTGQQIVQINAMHFGDERTLVLTVSGEPVLEPFRLKHGLNTFESLIDPVDTLTRTRVVIEVYTSKSGGGQRPSIYKKEFDLIQSPIIHRDIHLIHHSHTDIGYSHLQREVEVIQNNNIWKALELIDRTKDYPEGSRFVWNVESLWAVENFLGIASEVDKQRFIAAVKSGSIALSANYANILTGLCTPEEMHWIVEYADSLRKWYDLPITMAMQTDIPGMSWSMVDAYAAHGIRHLSQGPNYIPDMPDGGDRIGSTLREQGDKPYWWKGTTGRDSILVWTAGQGYGGWHGYTAGAIKERGTRKIAAYMNDLAAKGYPYDMVQWRYNIVSDNGPVDSTLSDFVREWNEKYSSPRLIIANAGTMIGEFETKYGKQIPTWSGDFTPYWEDGAYSTAKEEGEVRVISAQLSNLLDVVDSLHIPSVPYLHYRARRSVVLWHEHTWGAWCSISDPDAHFTTEQWRVKKAFADSAKFYLRAIERVLSARAQSIPRFVRFNGRRDILPPDLSNVAFPLVYALDPDSAGILEYVSEVWLIVDSSIYHYKCELSEPASRRKGSLHLALPFNIPNATVRIGIGDTCVTPESGRIPGSNNDFFCAQRWIDVSNDSMGVTIVCPQGAIWEVGEMVDERKVNPGKGTNPEMYKAWKTEAKSSSTIYLYALNNYWHTNFKADQEGPITFDIYLKMHGPFKLEEARRFGLEMTRPLITWWK